MWFFKTISCFYFICYLFFSFKNVKIWRLLTCLLDDMKIQNSSSSPSWPTLSLCAVESLGKSRAILSPSRCYSTDTDRRHTILPALVCTTHSNFSLSLLVSCSSLNPFCFCLKFAFAKVTARKYKNCKNKDGRWKERNMQILMKKYKN